MSEKQTKATEAPAYLREETQKWFLRVLSDYQLEPHHEKLLILACQNWDRAQECRAVLEKEGTFYTTKSGPKKHPANDILRDSTIVFARLIRELDLDTERPVEARRPPALRSIRGGGSHAS